MGALCGTMFALYALALALPGVREFFELSAPDAAIAASAVVGAALAIFTMALTGLAPRGRGRR